MAILSYTKVLLGIWAYISAFLNASSLIKSSEYNKTTFFEPPCENTIKMK